jgi:hypothetical protein
MFLVRMTPEKITQILRVYLGTTRIWGLIRSEIISTFLPLVKERFLASYALDRFQSSHKDLNCYVMSMVAAEDILEFEVRGS